VAALTFKSGAIGTYVASTAVYDGLPVRIDLFGTEGTAILEGDRLKLTRLKSGENYTTESAAHHALQVASGGTASVADHAALRIPTAKEGAVWGDAHRAQLENFVYALRTSTQPLIDGPAGRAAVHIIQGIYQSAKMGQPVTL
jgi:predicted dehydrogenase